MTAATSGHFNAACVASRPAKGIRSASHCAYVDVEQITINEGKLREFDQKGISA